MSSISTDNLDDKLLDNYRGLVVKKDLARRLKGGANVPSFVLEYLLANYCSTTDEDKLQEGLENVQKVLENHYVDPDQAENIKSDIKQKGGTYKIIDRISVKLNPS